MKYQVRTKPKKGVNKNCRIYFLDEFEIFDGESFVKFNLIGISKAKQEITVAITHEGRIAVVTYPLVKRTHVRAPKLTKYSCRVKLA